MAIMRREQAPISRQGREWDPIRAARSLLSWDPFQEMVPRLWRDNDQIAFVPAFDVKETKDAYEFAADLPGFREDDVDINVAGNRLNITGKRETESTDESDTYFYTERSSGVFTRAFTLPSDVNADQVQAELSDGVLRVRVPKVAKAQAKRIPVKAGEKPAAESQPAQESKPAQQPKSSAGSSKAESKS
jgi:HSP20 family protein